MRTTRKTLIIVLLILALCGLSALPQREAQAEPVNPGTGNLAAWWSFDEASGARNDSHGSSHLTDNNTVTSAAGKKSNAASFASANAEYLNRSDGAAISTGDIDFTWIGWVYLSSTSYQTFVSKGPTNGNGNQNEYQVYHETSRFHLLIGSGAAYCQVDANNFGAPSASTWYFVTAWHDAVNNQLGISINNGTPDTTACATGGHDNTNAIGFGRAEQYAGSYLNGALDEWALYKKILSADERAWIYNSGTGREYCEVANTCATATPTASNTPTNTPVNTATFTPSNTATFTPSNTATFTPSNTATFTPSKTFTPSNTPTFTNTVPGPTSTFTDTPTPSDTPTPTATATETMTPTITFTPTITSTPTITRTPGNFATAFWDGAITYGDSANVIVTSLLCLILIVALMAWLVTTNLQRKRK